MGGVKHSDQKETFSLLNKEFIFCKENFSSYNSIFDFAVLDLKQVLTATDKNDIILCFGFGDKENNQI